MVLHGGKENITDILKYAKSKQQLYFMHFITLLKKL